jgi:hypothetical protein
MNEESAVTDALLDGPHPSESAGAFRARVSLIERVSPTLRAMKDAGWQVMGEEAQAHPASQLRSDFVVQFGDLRLRILLFPEESRPLAKPDLRNELRTYLLASADTDALVVVADDDDTTSWITDVYELQRTEADTLVQLEGRPLRSALKEYALKNVFAIDVPGTDIQSSLPTVEDLRERLERIARLNFHETKESSKRVRIAEKRAALESLGPHELGQILEWMESALEGNPPEEQTLRDSLT